MNKKKSDLFKGNVLLAHEFFRLFGQNIFVKFKYPKITLLVLSIVFAYFCFNNSDVSFFVSRLGELSYLGYLIAGIFFAFGFTAPFSVGYFIVSSPENIYLAALAGGFGAFIGDIVIFKLVRFSFQDEFDELRREGLFRDFNEILNNTLGKRLMLYLGYAFAGFLIASPLPDEAGVTLIAGMTKIKESHLAVLSFCLNTLGIFVLLLLKTQLF
ncbi:MAG: hypothetical protein WC462_04705 [archaeon]